MADQVVSLAGMSADALIRLSEQAAALAVDLRKVEPSEKLGVLAGVRDCGYQTVRNGWVNDFRGEGIVTMADGRRWKAVGVGPRGTASTISRDGGIEFIPLD